MKRQQLVSLALLTGSDYTEGLQGVGPVFALEIMAEFPGEGVEQLENFKEWLNRVQKIKNIPPGNKIRQKIRNLQLIPGKNVILFIFLVQLVFVAAIAKKRL